MTRFEIASALPRNDTIVNNSRMLSLRGGFRGETILALDHFLTPNMSLRGAVATKQSQKGSEIAAPFGLAKTGYREAGADFFLFSLKSVNVCLVRGCHCEEQ